MKKKFIDGIIVLVGLYVVKRIDFNRDNYYMYLFACSCIVFALLWTNYYFFYGKNND
ncbi:hypothetical protein [Tepidibacter thalassicus]|uniref:hypothetical protein n=1 Tax=Tepidibacter thalassicus TaxID=214905 RepID=UPI0015B9CEE3|nr:hypothetical protein [Tepidibacter thalassicus]